MDHSPTLPTNRFSRSEGLKRQGEQLASLNTMLREQSERCELGRSCYGAAKAKGVEKRSWERDYEEVREQLTEIVSKLDEQKTHRSRERTLAAFSEKVLDAAEKNHRFRMSDMMDTLETATKGERDS